MLSLRFWASGFTQQVHISENLLNRFGLPHDAVLDLLIYVAYNRWLK